jgi:hypothetical protein
MRVAQTYSHSLQLLQHFVAGYPVFEQLFISIWSVSEIKYLFKHEIQLIQFSFHSGCHYHMAIQPLIQMDQLPLLR